MKKIIILMFTLMMCNIVFAHHHHYGRPIHYHNIGGHHNYSTPIHYHHTTFCGRNFWSSFVGGAIGTVVGNVITTPKVIQQPVVVSQQPIQVIQQPIVVPQTTVQQRVWIPGRYVEKIQDNGVIVRIWEPGHYEYR